VINFRYHLVSLVAVFLALAIGIVAGSTVIKESLLDQTQQNLDRASKNLKTLEDTNSQLQAQLNELRDRDKSLDALGPAQFLQGRLATMPVLMFTVDGVDGDAVTSIRKDVAVATNHFAGVVTFTPRLALTSGDDVRRLADILDTTTTDPTELRGHLADLLAVRVLEVALGRSTTVASGTRLTSSPDAPPSLVATRNLWALLRDLDDGGFVSLSQQPDRVDDLDLAGLRLLVMSGEGAKLDNAAFVYPFLQRLGDTTTPTAVAIEATRSGSNVERGSFVSAVRNDSKLRRRISTVDDVEWFAGCAAAVLALGDLNATRVGHYGVGKGADRGIPSVAS
jgi:hypothetical protein